MPSEGNCNDSYFKTDEDSVVEPSSQVGPVQTMSSVADSDGSETPHEQANTVEVGKQTKNTMVISSLRVGNKKRSRNEVMLNNALELLKEQPKEADE